MTSSDAVISYLKTSDLAERTQRLNDFSQLTGAVMKINPDVEAIMLYDAAEQLIATKGPLFFPRQDSIVTNGMYGFSGSITDKEMCIRDRSRGRAKDAAEQISISTGNF